MSTMLTTVEERHYLSLLLMVVYALFIIKSKMQNKRFIYFLDNNKAVKFLINYGANPNIKDQSRKSAIDVATEKGT